MKHFTLVMIVMWSVIGLGIIAAIIYGAIFFNSREGSSMSFFDSSDRSDMQLAADEWVPAQGLEKITLEFASDECNVYLTDEDKISVRHYVRGVPESCYAKLRTSGDTLTVSTKPESLSGYFSFGFSRRSIIDVYLPKAYKEALSVEIMSGMLTFDDDLDLSEVSVNMSSGTIRTDHEFKAPDVNISVTSGSMKVLGGITSDNYTLKTSSGSVNIGSKLVGSGSVNVTSGSIKLEGVDITESLSVKASSGTINIEIAGNPSLNVSGQKTSGTIRSYFYIPKIDNGSFSTTVGAAPYKDLDVSVTSGTIRITQAA